MPIGRGFASAPRADDGAKVVLTCSVASHSSASRFKLSGESSTTMASTCVSTKPAASSTSTAASGRSAIEIPGIGSVLALAMNMSAGSIATLQFPQVPSA